MGLILCALAVSVPDHGHIKRPVHHHGGFRHHGRGFGHHGGTFNHHAGGFGHHVGFRHHGGIPHHGKGFHHQVRHGHHHGKRDVDVHNDEDLGHLHF